jgi:actin-like ATPase involved in cell morphogenesis
LVADVLQKGLLLSGGLAKIHGLEDFLITKFSLPVALLDAPDLLASMGTVAMLKNIDLFSESLAFDA